MKMRSETDCDAPGAHGRASQPPADGAGPGELQNRLSSLAHELNNPLAAIAGFTQLLLKKQWPSDDRVALETINSEAMRAAAIAHDLLALTRARGGSDQAERALDVLLVGSPSKTLSDAKRLLTARGHAVLSAVSMEVALRLARNTPFDVVVSDQHAPSVAASVANTLRQTSGCAKARFVTSIPRLDAAGSERDEAVSATAEQVDADALRRLVEGE